VNEKIRKAFGELHRHGVMHGGVRAANILVAPHGSVSIIDFESGEVVSDSTKSEMAIRSRYIVIGRVCQ
jgi:tRNA A-37 threonylcarbamoyl transferase component Bud32